MKAIEARYEDGVLKRVEILPLQPGEKVGVILVRPPDPRIWDLTRLAEPPSDDEKYLAESGLKEWLKC